MTQNKEINIVDTFPTDDTLESSSNLNFLQVNISNKPGCPHSTFAVTAIVDSGCTSLVLSAEKMRSEHMVQKYAITTTTNTKTTQQTKNGKECVWKREVG